MTATVTRPADAAAPSPAGLSHKQIVVVLSGLMLGMLLAALDQTIVSTALPTITADLGGQQHLSWVVTAYLLTSTASTPLYGKISDLYGRKKIFQVAIVIFLIGSALAGLSQNMPELIATRALQGLGGGGLMTLAFAIIGDIISPRERGRYQGYFGAVFGLSSVAGPLLGGFFTDNLSWRWVFYINIPIGIVALVVTSAVLNIPFPRREHKIDYLGAALMVAGVASLLLVTVWGGTQYPWGSAEIIGLGVAGLVLIAVFCLREHYAAEPILPLRLFRNQVFSVTNAIAFIIGFALFGAIIFLPLYLQNVRGQSATRSGLQLLPLMVGVLTASIASGNIITRIGRYKAFPIIGTAVMAIGLFLMSTIGQHSSLALLSVYMLIVGLGVGCVMQVLTLAVQNSVDQRDLGVATSASTFFRSMGGSFGVAVFGAILTNRLSAYVESHGSPLLRAQAAAGLSHGSTTTAAAHANIPPELRELLTSAYAHAIQSVFFWGMPVVVVGFVLALVLHERRLRDNAHVGAVPVQAAPAADVPAGEQIASST